MPASAAVVPWSGCSYESQEHPDLGCGHRDGEPLAGVVFPRHGTAFNYQGALTENGAPGNGAYDFQFRLFDSANAGNAVGVELARAPVQVIEGNFNVLLDFGQEAFDGRPRWLELAVRSNGVVQAHTVFSPRQQILPVPYAIFAVTASNVLNNAITGLAIQNATLTADKFSDGQVMKSLNALHDHVVLQAGANVTVATNGNALIIGALGGGGGEGSGGDDWHVTGNAGTAPPVHFLGTTDDQPFEIKVKNLRALRVQPDAASFICDLGANVIGIAKSPSLIGGYAGNIISAGIAGSVIGGGGAFNHPGLGGELANIITADFANINGGLGNRADGTISTIGGGARNRTGSGANYAVIGFRHIAFANSIINYTVVVS